MIDVDVAFPDPVFSTFVPNGKVTELYADDPSVEFMTGVADARGVRSKRPCATVWVNTGTALTRWETGEALNMNDCYVSIPVSLLMLRRSASAPTSVNLVAEVAETDHSAMGRYGTHVHRCMARGDTIFTAIRDSIPDPARTRLTVAPGKVLLMFGLVREGVIRVVELGSTASAARHVCDLDPTSQRGKFSYSEDGGRDG